MDSVTGSHEFFQGMKAKMTNYETQNKSNMLQKDHMYDKSQWSFKMFYKNILCMHRCCIIIFIGQLLQIKISAQKFVQYTMRTAMIYAHDNSHNKSLYTALVCAKPKFVA